MKKVNFRLTISNVKDLSIHGHVNFDGMDYKYIKCYIYVAIFDAPLYVH